MRIGTWCLHWPTGTRFQFMGRNNDGLLCGIEKGTRAFVVWPASECSEVGEE
jgi:hypothetical protein